MYFPDQEYIIKKCPSLISEMIDVVAKMVKAAHRNSTCRCLNRY